jgi:hypothetical protein
MISRYLRSGVILGTAFILAAGAWAAGVGGATPPVVRPARDGYQAEVLAHAWPDEYFYGIGSTSNLYLPEGIADPTVTPCPSGSVAKVNQSYVWGLGKSGDDIYFGTLANGNLLVMAVYLDTGGTNDQDSGTSYAQVQEGEASYYGQQHGGKQDWRPPQLHRYNLATRALELLDPGLPLSAQAALETLGGIRAGGAATTNAYNSHRMVMLAGPPLDHNAGGVGFFLFDATTTQFVGSTINRNYNNIRRMVSVNGDLYFGVQRTNTLDGAVVRWVNNPRLAGWPFVFQEVGTLDQMGADICVHEGRLFCTTWPGYVEAPLEELVALDPAEMYRRAPGLWMSPVVPAAGLTTAHRTQWQKVWSIANYEPDQVIALTMGGGALASFDGYLYFGTMQVPGTGQIGYQFMYGLPVRPQRPSTNGLVTAEEWLTYTNQMREYRSAQTNYNRANSAIYTNVVRPAAIFRGRNFRAPTTYQGTILNLGGDFELLYGDSRLPVFVPPPVANDYFNTYYAPTNWIWTTNKMGQTPAMGAAGFGSRENVYTWSMEVFRNALFVGTFDGSLPRNRSQFGTAATNAAVTYGSDLYRLHSSQASRFSPVSLNGLGNICNYGFRTMASDAAGLYIGTANPRNLLPNPTNSPSYGGWELLKLTRQPTVPFDATGDFLADTAWMTAAGTTVVVRSGSGSVTNYPGTRGVLAAWADYDRDGVSDPAWCDPARGTWTAWLSSRDFQRSTLPTFAYSGAVPVPADFDGDGKADQALCATTGGRITWRSTKDGRTYSVTPTGTPALPAVGDYNGDGLAEMVWYVPGTGTAAGRLVRSASATVAKLTTQTLAGSFRGVPVPADYDGDGRTDFVLWAPVSTAAAGAGRIRVWRSSDGTVVDSPLPPGDGAAWVPMPADYDGDGKADFAWFDALNAVIEWVPSSTGVAEPPADVSAAVPRPGSRPVTAPHAVWATKL